MTWGVIKRSTFIERHSPRFDFILLQTLLLWSRYILAICNVGGIINIAIVIHYSRLRDCEENKSTLTYFNVMVIVSFWTEYSTSLLCQISQTKVPNKMAQYGPDHHIVVHLYHAWEKIGGGKMANCEPFANFLFTNYFCFRNTKE